MCEFRGRIVRYDLKKCGTARRKYAHKYKIFAQIFLPKMPYVKDMLEICDQNICTRKKMVKLSVSKILNQAFRKP